MIKNLKKYLGIDLFILFLLFSSIGMLVCICSSFNLLSTTELPDEFEIEKYFDKIGNYQDFGYMLIGKKMIYISVYKDDNNQYSLWINSDFEISNLSNSTYNKIINLNDKYLCVGTKGDYNQYTLRIYDLDFNLVKIIYGYYDDKENLTVLDNKIIMKRYISDTENEYGDDYLYDQYVIISTNKKGDIVTSISDKIF